MLNGQACELGISAIGDHLDRSPDPVVGATAANIGHCLVNVGVCRHRFGLEQSRCRHDHSALAKPALRHVERGPGFLHWMRPVGRQPFDSHYLRSGTDARDWPHATARGYTVDMHRAGAALCNSAAVFRSGQAELFPQHPQQWRIGLGFECAHCAVDV